jgi:multiple sugar transport system permease protein
MQTLKEKTQNELWGYAFIAPQFLGILLFTLVPVIQSFFISFTKWDLMSPAKLVGFENYRTVLSDPLTLKVLGNTFFIMLGHIPLTLLFSLLVALALNNRLRGAVFYRTLYFLPNVTSSVAVSLVWLWMFNPDMGMINAMLGLLGVKGPGWLSSTTWALPSVIIVTVWEGIGYCMVVLLAGIGGISETYYEAARIDGANGWTCFSRITLPMLTPTLFFLVITMLIGDFQIFNEVYMMTRGGPADATNTVVLLIYNTAFKFFKMGPAAVLSWILFIIIMLATLFQFKVSKKWVNYDV